MSINIIKKQFAQRNWVTSEGHAAKTRALTNLMGKCTRIDVIISSVTDNPTVTLTFTDTTNGGTYYTTAALADGTHHILLSESGKNSADADFNPFLLLNNDLTVSMDPSADPGGSGQTLTVDVYLYME